MNLQSEHKVAVQLIETVKSSYSEFIINLGDSFYWYPQCSV